MSDPKPHHCYLDKKGRIIVFTKYRNEFGEEVGVENFITEEMFWSITNSFMDVSVELKNKKHNKR